MPQIDQSTKEFNLPGPIVSYLRAVNTGTKEEFPASFADDAVVVDVNRELRGLDAITAWAGADIFGVHVHFDVLDVTERQGRTIVRVKIDVTVQASDTWHWFVLVLFVAISYALVDAARAAEAVATRGAHAGPARARDVGRRTVA
jgi:hypothetical protein